ncbi:hypothetical protein A6A19_02065 [Actinobacillus delphinicola]|uniref:Multidrug ABC transporter ATPase n=1 Tax=Actinobacillus delphinicola TaxID=51161 RepID=A0A448TRZ7_9PAST|nr:ABC transporter permease [Actinobacillus delphinicola]MDG6896813.1 hypothetical protein [Actinobacillus delphinicola]VEJ08621.1 multidrug ABC transporter ATPase [Actinobacillus delphinicola]
MLTFSFERFFTLFIKECKQLRKDPSPFWVGVVVPVFMLILFGYGLSLDLNRISTVIVTQERTTIAEDIVARFRGSPYFDVIVTPSQHQAEQLMHERKVNLIIDIPQGFTQNAVLGRGKLGVIIHGVDANAAAITRYYVMNVIAQENLSFLNKTLPTEIPKGISINTRARFNEADRSSWYLVPGLIVVIMTLVGSFLTSTVIAREYERGTMNSLIISTATPLEIGLAKIMPYFFVAFAGFMLCLIASIAIFHVPVRGSLILLVLTSVVYLSWALAFGLWLSALVKKQFLANQYAIIGSFMPALILSGFLFDLRSIPTPLAVIGHLMPPTYAIESFKILYLSGMPMFVVWRNIGILLVCALIFFIATLRLLRKVAR